MKTLLSQGAYRSGEFGYDFYRESVSFGRIEVLETKMGQKAMVFFDDKENLGPVVIGNKETWSDGDETTVEFNIGDYEDPEQVIKWVNLAIHKTTGEEITGFNDFPQVLNPGFIQ